MEQRQKIVAKDAPREWIDATGGLSQTGDAQYIFRGKVLALQTEQVASTVAQAGNAGNVARNFGLGDVGGLSCSAARKPPTRWAQRPPTRK